jgi:hypothetical protein
MASTSDLEGQSLTEIAEYHNDVVDSLTFFFQQFRFQSNSRFIGYTLEEFDNLLLGRIEETDLRSSLAVLAAVEAALRIDYLLRAKMRRKDPLSKAFRAIYRKKQENARFDEDLLDLWGQYYPELKRLIGELRAALHFRHWLAHGRYWERPTHGRFDYISVYTLADILLSNFPLFQN